MKTKPQKSCRFAPYYRVQRFDEISQVWRPLRGMFPTESAAKVAAGNVGKTRIEIVTEDGRRFV